MVLLACASGSPSSPRSASAPGSTANEAAAPADPSVDLSPDRPADLSADLSADPSADLSADPSGTPESPTVEPDLLTLLTAHREAPDTPAAAQAPPAEGPPSCHQEHPDAPADLSRCICTRACGTTIDRAALARRQLDMGKDPVAVQAWLDAHTPGSLHYPYVEVDGLLINFDGEGTVTRCTHSILRVPGSKITLECATLGEPGAA